MAAGATLCAWASRTRRTAPGMAPATAFPALPIHPASLAYGNHDVRG